MNKSQEEYSIASLAAMIVWAGIVGAYLALSGENKEHLRRDRIDEEGIEVKRFRDMLRTKQLVHPYLDREDDGGESTIQNFADLSNALAAICGAKVDENNGWTQQCDELIRDVGGTGRKHIIFILCDGMGNNILNQHLRDPSLFLHRFNQPTRLRAVFPSTTPAALTTLATARWPGQHGVPGWDLRVQLGGCEFPGRSKPLIQLRVLAPDITDSRSGKRAPYEEWEDIFVANPWSKNLPEQSRRKMVYISAYNGDGDTCQTSEFSSWQMSGKDHPFCAQKIGETSFETLGEPGGSRDAVRFFADGIDQVLRTIAEAERADEPTFIYLYTAHPDKHMHALGTEHGEVGTVVQGINRETARLWEELGDRNKLLHNEQFGETVGTAQHTSQRVDASIVVTADHGHIDVSPSDRIILPDAILECLDYANVGVWGKGRHGYLHCRPGLQNLLRKRWRNTEELVENFLLLTIEEASDLRLFGPEPLLIDVRPRMGDFVAIAVGNATLVTSEEDTQLRGRCQGAHGSLLPEEMSIPFVLCTPLA